MSRSSLGDLVRETRDVRPTSKTETAQRRPMHDPTVARHPRSTILFQFPPGPGGIVITQEDRDRLRSRDYINDSLVELFGKWLSDPRRAAANTADSHIFSPFLYEKIRKRCWKAVSKWTREINIFRKRFLFLPINRSQHWYLAIIANPSSALTGRDELNGRFQAEGPGMDQTRQRCMNALTAAFSKKLGDNPAAMVREPVMFLLDSLGNADKKLETAMYLNEWLAMEAEIRIKRPITRQAYPFHPQVPTQENFVDCGLYVLHYAQVFLSDPEKYLIILLGSVGKERRHINKAWDHYLAKEMRKRFDALLVSLSESNRWKEEPYNALGESKASFIKDEDDDAVIIEEQGKPVGDAPSIEKNSRLVPFVQVPTPQGDSSRSPPQRLHAVKEGRSGKGKIKGVWGVVPGALDDDPEGSEEVVTEVRVNQRRVTITIDDEEVHEVQGRTRAQQRRMGPSLCRDNPVVEV